MSRVHIIMYHYVRDLKNSRYPGIKGLDYELFKQQIAFLKEHFTIVTMEEVLRRGIPRVAHCRKTRRC